MTEDLLLTLAAVTLDVFVEFSLRLALGKPRPLYREF
jgi:hypothetical protein